METIRFRGKKAFLNVVSFLWISMYILVSRIFYYETSISAKHIEGEHLYNSIVENRYNQGFQVLTSRQCYEVRLLEIPIWNQHQSVPIFLAKNIKT